MNQILLRAISSLPNKKREHADLMKLSESAVRFVKGCAGDSYEWKDVMDSTPYTVALRVDDDLYLPINIKAASARSRLSMNKNACIYTYHLYLSAYPTKQQLSPINGWIYERS